MVEIFFSMVPTPIRKNPPSPWGPCGAAPSLLVCWDLADRDGNRNASSLVYPLVNQQFADENGASMGIVPIQRVIFYSYVGLPEGNDYNISKMVGS